VAKTVKTANVSTDHTPPTVAVVGGGLGGLTSAFYLSRAGFKVTLFEGADILGGNFSSSCVNGVYHDVYPHIFCPWYANFWNLFENDLALGARDDNFAARWGVKILDKDAKDYISLESPTTLQSVIANLGSGLARWPDLFLLGFSMIDLAATPFDRKRDDQLENLDVNGFVYSRGYSTQAVAHLQNYILMLIWSIQSELTAASSYQDFIKHTIAFPEKTPFSYLLEGPLQVKIIDPMEKKLAQLGCVVRKNAKVKRIELVDNKTVRGMFVGGRPKITLEPTPGAAATEDSLTFDYLVLATTPEEAARLILEGADGVRIGDAAPHLSQLQRLRSESIPVLDVYFNKKLPNLPDEMFALAGSKQTYARQSPTAPESADCDMTVLDISQLWTNDPNMAGRTALCVASSNRYALPARGPEELGFLMIQHLHDYLPLFEPGQKWGDTASDICWEKTHLRLNDHHQLFLDEVGSWNVRPDAAHPSQIPDVFFAGDYCRTDVDMATIEGAVQSGILAAQGVQAQHARVSGDRLGAPIPMAKHKVYSDAHFLAVKLALLPFAYGASALSAQMDPGPAGKDGVLPANAYKPSTYSLLLPLAFTLDWWKTAYWLARRLTPGPGQGDSESEGHVNLLGFAREMADAAIEAVVGPRTPEGEFKPGERIGPALNAFSAQAWRTAKAAFPQTADPAAGEPRRRRRVKA
jgi:hypothetical protein